MLHQTHTTSKLTPVVGLSFQTVQPPLTFATTVTSLEMSTGTLIGPPCADYSMDLIGGCLSPSSLTQKCIIKQLDTGLHLYSATFCGLTKAPPSPEKLFGPLYRYIADWRLASGSNPNFFYFGATDSAKQKWTSGKQFLREVGEVKAVLPDMY